MPDIYIYAAHAAKATVARHVLTTMARNTRSRSTKTVDPPLSTARAELLVCGWRIIRAVEAYPNDGGLLTASRWNAGLAREAVRSLFGDFDACSDNDTINWLTNLDSGGQLVL